MTDQEAICAIAAIISDSPDMSHYPDDAKHNLIVSAAYALIIANIALIVEQTDALTKELC